MSETKRIKTALVSVYHKEGLDEIITKLHEEGVEFLSTGGTRQFIESLGYPCKAVEDLTTYPSILGGRVKTLHPKVFGGILCRRGLEQDMQQIEKYEIPEIDLVIVDLYPFEATVASGADEPTIIEKIDIGGISLIRAAAKNYNDVVIIASQAQYQPFRDMLMEHGATTSLEERRWFAKEAFSVSSHYDSAIFNYFDGEEGSAFRCSANNQKTLRYGENPHQKGHFYGNLEAMFDQIHGKEISYNNLLDINAAVDLIDEFEETTFAVLKHNNACGLASRPTVLEAWNDALAGDPVSAFGGVLITNGVIDKDAAEEINKILLESTQDLTSRIKTNCEKLSTTMGQSADNFDTLGKIMDEQLKNVKSQAENYTQQISAINKNISALNALYELQIHETQDCLESFRGMQGDMNEMLEHVSLSVDSAKLFKQESQQLANNVASLNSVYGNMLSVVNNN